MKLFVYTLLTVISMLSPGVGSAQDARQIVGLIEKVRINPGNILMTAKLDTGADNSSLHAIVLGRFTRDGENWIRFRVINREAESVVLERKLIRVAKIKRQDSRSQKRPVVNLEISLGAVSREAPVTLVDRGQFSTDMIIGRSFMTDKLLVDPSKRYTVEPSSRVVPEP